MPAPGPSSDPGEDQAQSGIDDRASEAWRHACEVRWIARLPTDQDRADYLAIVATRRGPDAANALRIAAWKVMRNPAPPHDGGTRRNDAATPQPGARVLPK